MSQCLLSRVCHDCDVRIAGVKVGSVKSIVLNPQTYRAHISLTIKSDIQIPEESAIQVVSDGLLGGKHLAISPNVSKIFMKAGDTIENTQSSVNLESLLSKFMFNAPENKK